MSDWCHCLCFWCVYSHFYMQLKCVIFMSFMLLPTSLSMHVFVLYVSKVVLVDILMCLEHKRSGRSVVGVFVVVSHVCAQ